MKKYLEYIHIDTGITSIDSFLEDKDSVGHYFSGKKSEFLAYKDNNNVTNLEKVWSRYTDEEKDQYQNNYSSGTLDFLKIGTPLVIPCDQSNIELIAIRGKDLFLEQTNATFFIADELLRLMNDPNYTQALGLKTFSGKNSFFYLQNTFQVWVWMRSLNKIINISPFVNNIQTTVNGQNNQFSFSIDPVKNLDEVFKSSKSYFNYFQIEDSEGNFEVDFFTKHIQQNDIVFVRFERLELENRREDSYSEFEISNNQLPNQVYDMIGLVDTLQTQYTSVSNDVQIQVSGRDLNKMLVEDGSYFFALALIEGAETFFINPQNDNKFLKRLFVSTEFKTLFGYSFRSIKDSLGFIINQIANTGLLPENSSLFKSYEDDKISKVYDIEGGGDTYKQELIVNGVWQIIKLLVDDTVNDRRLVNSDINRPDGTLLEQFNKICQQPFVEFFGDTYYDTFKFIVRQPPFTQSQILDFLKFNDILEIDIESGRLSNVNLQWETTSYSWYQIKPSQGFLGRGDFISFAHVPAVYLSEYIEAFGNHRMITPLNYVSYQGFFGETGKTNFDLFRQSVANDLKYIIDVNSYLPFTRKGTIIIDGGDRRIKYGTWIYLKATGELCYVNSVNHVATASRGEVNRVTTLQVSRCMVLDYVKGKDVDFNGNTVNVSYFNIVDTDLIRNLLVKTLTGDQNKSYTQSLVNKDIFSFFLQRRQFS